MAIGFGPNIQAAKSIRFLDRSTRALSQANTQLSSGLRINGASDDPASLAVGMRLNADARVTMRAKLNISDGISLLQIADSAFQNTADVARRIAELTQQAANGSLSSTQRSALNRELSQLKSELLRTRDSVTFNGQNILKGGATSGVSTEVASGTNSRVSVSSDGRYVTYFRGSAIYQTDTTTGATTTISSLASSVGPAVTSRGDYVAYWGSGNALYLWDRSTGATTTFGTTTNVDLLALSEDGSTFALVSRVAYDTSGNSLGNLGNRYLSLFNTATGAIKGDNGLNGFTSYSSLAISPDGSRVALSGTGNIGTVINTSDLTTSAFQTTGYTTSRVRFGADNSLLFLSSGNVGGLNPSGIANVFKYDGTTYSAVTSITSGAGVSTFFSTDLGNSITFASSSNILGTNPGAITQIYKKDLVGDLRQLSAFTGTEASNLVNVSGDGFTIYTSSVTSLQAVNIESQAALDLEIGAGGSGRITASIRALDAAVRGLYSLDVSTQRFAQLSLELINDNIARLGSTAGELGASLSRLDSAFRATTAKATEITSAADRLMSADIAVSISERVRQSTLQEIQSSILSQTSRLSPQIALRLLQDSAG